MKKLFVLFLAVVLMLAVMPAVSVAAAKTPTFVIGTAEGDVGDTVKITVSTKNNTGIISMKLLVKYDSAAMKLTEVEDGKFKSIVFSSEDSNPFVMNWIDALNPNNKTNGVVATLTFKILDTAPNGKSEISLTYDPEDVFDVDFNNVTFDVENGYVDITNSNANAETNTSDVDSSDASSDTMIDTTNSAILEQIYDQANKNDDASKPLTSDNSITQGDKTTDEDDAQNSWIVWVVVAAVLVLCGAFVVVIIKSKKDKTK